MGPGLQLGSLTLVLVAVTLSLSYENVFINLRQRRVTGFSEFITFLEPIEEELTEEADLSSNISKIYTNSHETPEEHLCSAKALLKIDMSGPFSGLTLQLSYSRPRLWTFHLSDSIFARGYGESEWKSGPELHIFNRQMRIYSNRDSGYRDASIDGGNLLRTVDNVIHKRSRVKLDLTDNSVSWDINTNKSDNSIQSRYLFNWKNESRAHLYVGLNRAVGMPVRRGHGLCGVTIIFQKSRDKRDNCIAGVHNCDKNAVCRPKKNHFKCICKAGFRGNGHHCSDIDECNDENVNCVHKCENTVGSYKCTCHQGFQLEANGFNCIDVDECAVNNGGCEQKCLNSIGSFICLCEPNFRLAADGYSCVRTASTSFDICDETDCDQGCDHRSGNCYCETGYSLMGDRRTCATDTCAIANGGCQHTCVNTVGGPLCGCAAGYNLGIDKKSCEASCLVNNGGCDHHCEQNGAVTCSCQSGYKLGQNQRSCHDIDECQEKGTECEFACRNLEGDYECYCPPGYLLHSNQHNCIDVDECEFQSACEHTCINTPGSFYCECRAGYTLLSGGRCARENECSIANGRCQRGCEDKFDGYKCTCPPNNLLHPNGKDCTRVKNCNSDDNSVYPVDNTVMCLSHPKGIKCAIDCRNGLDMKLRPPGNFQFFCAHRNSCDKRTSQPIRLRYIVDSCNVSSWSQPVKSEFQGKSEICLSKLSVCSLNVTCRPASFEGFQFLGNTFILTIQIAMSPTVKNEAIASITVTQMIQMIDDSLRQVGLSFRHKLTEYHFRPQQLSSRYSCSTLKTSKPSEFCTECSSGSYFDPRYGHCLPCPYGTYQPEENSLFCRTCPSALKISEFGPKGAKSLNQCPGLCKSGFVSQTGLEPCRPCKFGYYQPDVGRVSCISCGRDISTDLKGSRHFSDCQINYVCEPGQYYSVFSTKCEPCARGYYQPNEGQSYCIKCPIGTTTDNAGTADKEQCKRTNCEGDVRGPMGYFQSPNFPSDYPTNSACKWEIGPFKRRRILLVIPDIQLADQNCEDYLVIRKNSSPYSLLTFESCESKSQPQAFVARSKRISVEFRSDHVNTAKGFRAHYVTYDESYHRLIEDIIRDSRLYSFQGHDQILQNKKLLNALLEVIAEPSRYHKYANVTQSIFPKSFIDLLAPKVQRFFQIFGGV